MQRSGIPGVKSVKSCRANGEPSSLVIAISPAVVTMFWAAAGPARQNAASVMLLRARTVKNAPYLQFSVMFVSLIGFAICLL